MTGDGRVVLAATSTGSVLSIGWPQHPELGVASPTSATVQSDNNFSMPGSSKAAPASPDGKLALPLATAYKHLSVHIEGAINVSSCGTSINSGSSTTRSHADLQGSSPGATHPSAHPKGKSAHGAAGKSSVTTTQGVASNHGSRVEKVNGDSLNEGRHEYRLHAARITAIKILHHAGVMFTAR